MLFILLAAYALAGTMWISTTTGTKVSWSKTGHDVVMCFDDPTTGFACCDPDRQGKTSFLNGEKEAWTYSSALVHKANPFYLCIQGDDAWGVDVKADISGDFYETNGDVCLSKDVAECQNTAFIAGGNCLKFHNGQWTTTQTYPGSLVTNGLVCAATTETDKPPVCDVYTDPECPNYEGGYVAGKGQTGFDDEHFKTTETEHVEQTKNIDDILEDMETDFEDEGNQWNIDIVKAFDDKEDAYNDVVAAEGLYVTKMTAREGAEEKYNTARIAEEAAHADLLLKVTAYNTAVSYYQVTWPTYKERMDFLNYELYIIQQIRELLGENIGYSPTQIVLDIVPHDDNYEDFVSDYPAIKTSSFSAHRFARRKRKRGGKKKRRRRRRR